MMTPPSHEGGNAYQLGMMAEAVRQNTQTVLKLAEAVEENSRISARLSSRQDRMELTMEQIQTDQRKMINMSMAGQKDEIEIRKRFEWVDRKYQEEQSSSASWITRKNAIYISIMIALFWFMFALVKDAAVAEVATQLRNQTEIRNKG